MAQIIYHFQHLDVPLARRAVNTGMIGIGDQVNFTSHRRLSVTGSMS
jgi:hypothetical protein